MTIKELKEILNDKYANDDAEVSICIETLGGWTCPDGATCEIRNAVFGFDWHQNELLIVPKYRLKLLNDETIEKWSKRQ